MPSVSAGGPAGSTDGQLARAKASQEQPVHAAGATFGRGSALRGRGGAREWCGCPGRPCNRKDPRSCRGVTQQSVGEHKGAAGLTRSVAQLLDGPHNGEQHQAAAHNVHQMQNVLPAAPDGGKGRAGSQGALAFSGMPEPRAALIAMLEAEAAPARPWRQGGAADGTAARSASSLAATGPVLPSPARALT